ncbi:protein of unknown function [Ruminococcaceae bacterium BL-4]|nr:protein of unknown function [Ruminococcaceae bacterium BL-4]
MPQIETLPSAWKIGRENPGQFPPVSLCELELKNKLMVGRVRPVEREAVVRRQGQRAGSARIQRSDLQR